MRFVFHTSASTGEGTPRPQRYLEVLDEAVAAEAAGFDTVSFGEQHFNTDNATQVSSPEMMTAAVAARTSTIRLRTTSTILLAFNHPIRVAERLATLDLISGGRAEMATARSNHSQTMAAFEIDPTTTKSQWRESLDVIVAALTQDPFRHDGEHWHIPPTHLVPVALQLPHPPLYYASTSTEGVELAGHLGLGVISGNSLTGGWDHVADIARAYHSAVDTAEPISVVNRSLGTSIMTAHCAPTMDQALEEAAATAAKMLEMVVTMFSTLGAQGGDYAYMSDIEQIVDRVGDLAYINARSPYVSIGDPDFLIERFRRLESLGYDEVLLRIDGMGHETNLRSIEMFGEHVIPAFR
jgi:alkanesulfonate monooxygenase SsuD/methylene tetrahydromethanopterin reductase-like flavin-dependent oxidoreductase (luciferase family)